MRPPRNPRATLLATSLVLLAACANHRPDAAVAQPNSTYPGLNVNRDYDATGPLTLAITYRCRPADRPVFRRRLVDTIAPRFEQWRSDGTLHDYEVFFNWYVDAVTYDAMILVHFDDYATIDRWKQVETRLPGGLTAEDLALAEPMVTSSADVVWHNPGAGGPRSEHSVMLLIPYVYLGLVADYCDYVDGYVVPQLEGWLADGVLCSYRIVLNRFPTGDRWKSYLLLEYTDRAAFGRRKHTKLKVRETLRDDPVWSELSARKQTIRRELEPIIAERLLPRN